MTKQWVTIKIPLPTRDQAQGYDETYEEIMQAGMEVIDNRKELLERKNTEEFRELEPDPLLAGLERVEEQLAHVPERTAEELEERFR